MLSTDPDEYPSTNFAPQGAITSLNAAWAVDYSKVDPDYAMTVVGGTIWSSINGGSTWTQKAASPGGLAGALAVQSSTSAMWVPLNNVSPKYSTDGGANWTDSTFGGSALTTGWSFSSFLIRHIVCADLVNSTDYYAFNQTNGVYKSTDGGATFTLVHNMTGLIPDSGVGCNLAAVPNNAGHLFLAFGYLNGPGSTESRLVRSSDGGVNWTTVTSTYNVWNVALGKAGSGKTYPAVYISGYVDGDSTPGIFRCDDATTNAAGALTWTRLTSAPDGKLDAPHSLAASLDTYGLAYVGFGASGAAYSVPGMLRFSLSLT